MFNTKYEVIDEAYIGNIKYELRQTPSGQQMIYVYSELQKIWSPYAKKFVEEKWNSIKKLQ